MLTTVRRDILDQSISGNKIFGGIINYIDGLHTTNINVPQGAAAPSAGTGLIDGLGVLIGSRSKISNVQSNVIGAHSTLGLRNAAFTDYSFIAQRDSGGVRVNIKNSSGDVKIKLHSGSDKSFFLDKLMVGRNSESYSGVALEVTSGVIDNLLWAAAQGPSAVIDNITTRDSNLDQVDLVDIIDMVYNLDDVIINGNELKEPFKTLSVMSPEQAQQLCTIIPSDDAEILEENWAILPSLNQELGTSNSPAFDGVYVGDVIPELGAPTNFLSDYKEWIAVPLEMQLSNALMVTVSVLVDIVKCGKLVTISVLAADDPHYSINLKNSSGTPKSGALIITISDSVYAPIWLDSVMGPLAKCSLYRVSVDGVYKMCHIAPPVNDSGTKRIFIWSQENPVFSLNNGKTIQVQSFSFSYIVS